MTVKQAVVKAIIENYPHVKNHIIEKAHPIHKLSGLQRLRELRKLGVIYTFDPKTNSYDFSQTSLTRLKGEAMREAYKSGIKEIRKTQRGDKRDVSTPQVIPCRTVREGKPAEKGATPLCPPTKLAGEDEKGCNRGFNSTQQSHPSPAKFIGCFEIREGRLF